jgi:RHS repeat-associated protein
MVDNGGYRGGGGFGGGGASGGGNGSGNGGNGGSGGSGGGAPAGGNPSRGGGQGAGGGGARGGGAGGRDGGGGGGSGSGGGGGGPTGGGGGGGPTGGGGGGGPTGGGGGGGGGPTGGGGGGTTGGGGAGSGPDGSGPGAGGGTAGGGLKGAIGAGAARVANTLKTTLEIKDTGNAKVDALGDVFNAKLALFTDAPPPEQGALGWVNQGIQAAMAVKDFTSIGQELMDTGFAMATAGIAAMMPALPAAFLTVPHLGTPHAHAHPPSLVPPAPPVPLPSIGTLMLAGSVGVLIMGMPAARCGDLGLAMTCGSFSPAFDVFLGSSNTFIAGNRAARMGDMTRHCNPSSAALAMSRGAALFSAGVAAVGVAADAVGGGPVMGAVAQIAADLAAAAMSALLGKDPGIPPSFGALMLGAPTVLIGGFPCPNLPNPLDALMHGLKCLGKAISKSKSFGKLLSKVGRCNDPNEPVSTFTGEVYNDYEDYRASDSAFVWSRHYRSGWNQQDGPLGFGHRHFFQRTLTLHRKRAVYETHDNEVVALERLFDGSFEPIAGYTLTSTDGRHFQLTTDSDETLDFEVLPTTPPSSRLVRYRREKLDIYCHYDSKGRLLALTESLAGRLVDTRFGYDADGRIDEAQRGERGPPAAVIVRYRYADGCLSEIHNSLGGITRFRYDSARRLVQATDSRYYSFHWHYDSKSGRCIKSYGDDGVLAGDAVYRGTQSTFTDATGGEWHYKHYPDGMLSHVVDPLGGITQYVKDDLGRIALQVQPDGQEYVWLYDDDGKHIGRLTPFDELVPPEDEDPDPPSGLEHDGPETPVEWLWGRGHASATQAMPRLPGPVLASLAPAPALTRVSTYDGAGNVVQTTHAGGQVEYYQYDTEGNAVAHLDTRGNWWQQRIVSWNLVGAERTPLGSVTQYGYSHLTECTLVTDANGNRTDYLRNAQQDIVEIVQNGKIYLRYEHTVGGTVLEERDGNDVSLVSYTADERGLHSSATLASGEKYIYAYDSLGNFSEASSSVHKIEQRHDGRRLSADLRDGVGVEHEFGEDGVTLSVLFQRFRIEYESDAKGVSVTSPDGGAHRFWRDSDGTLGRENANGTGEAQVFDGTGRLVSRACWRGEGPQAIPTWVCRYSYDLEGLLLETLDSERGPTRYAYDADKRLLSQQGKGSAQHDFRYDAAGNLTYTPAHGPIDCHKDNVLAHSHVERFEYDDRHRLARRVKYDGTETSYLYDSVDQLVEVTWSDRPEKWKAAYDGLGRRLWREYGGQRTDFYWDGDRLAGELAPDGSLRVYVYQNEDALVPFLWLDYASKDADPATGIPHYLFTAPNGMPLRVEDATGQVTWQSEGFDAYGHQATGTAPPPLRLRFAGHFYDEALGLFYNRFRDYDPTLARYLQPDPLGHEGGLNLYAYPANPEVDVDLRGLSALGHKKPGKPGAKRGKGNSNGRPKKGAKKKQDLVQGEVGSYRDQKKKAAAPSKLDRDHIPSKAAVKRALEKKLGRPLKPNEARNVDNNLSTAAIKTTTHKEGRTHGSKNTKAQIDKDSGNLRQAANKDLAAHREKLKKDGMTDAQIKKMEKDLHDRNRAIGVYDKPPSSKLLCPPE